jgi:glucose-6-phosphate 1-dehydrogenase
MDFSYGASFRSRPAEAYERLLHDARASDQTLFLREDGVERSWEIVRRCSTPTTACIPMQQGTWAPRAADDLIAPRVWRAS